MGLKAKISKAVDAVLRAPNTLISYRGEPAYVARWRSGLLSRFPVVIRGHAVAWHRRTAAATDYAEANRRLKPLVKRLKLEGVGLRADTPREDVEGYADQITRRLERDFFARIRADKEYPAVKWLLLAAGSRGMPVPTDKQIESVEHWDELAPYVNRVLDPDWWVRGIIRRQRRAIEQCARELGVVSAYKQAYCTDYAVEDRKQQKERNKAILQELEAESEDGEVINLYEIVQGSVANPKIRRMELMTRMRGFEDVAYLNDHIGMFYTLTTPSKFHCRLSKADRENGRYEGATPRDAQDYLCELWARIRADLKRRGIEIYGFRVAEPHHDGTPHWHMLVFMDPVHKDTVTDIMCRHAMAVDGNEPGAKKYRFEAVEIDPDKGSATGYIAKYISKNIDGEHIDHDDESGIHGSESALRVDAWASRWGIRQFQQIGGPSVTLWRELRRIDESQIAELLETHDLGLAMDKPDYHVEIRRVLYNMAATDSLSFKMIWEAADQGDWMMFCMLQGGPTLARKKHWLRPVWTENDLFSGEQLESKYGDLTRKIMGVGRSVVKVITRGTDWVIRSARGGTDSEASASPWSSVNNCTGASPPDDETEFIRLDLLRGPGESYGYFDTVR